MKFYQAFLVHFSPQIAHFILTIPDLKICIDLVCCVLFEHHEQSGQQEYRRIIIFQVG